MLNQIGVEAIQQKHNMRTRSYSDTNFDPMNLCIESCGECLKDNLDNNNEYNVKKINFYKFQYLKKKICVSYILISINLFFFIKEEESPVLICANSCLMHQELGKVLKDLHTHKIFDKIFFKCFLHTIFENY